MCLGPKLNYRIDHAHSQTVRGVRGQRVCSAAGVNHQYFDVGVTLSGKTGNGLLQRRPIHAADNDADQGQLVRICRQPQRLALHGPESHRRDSIRLLQSFGWQVPEGLCRLDARTRTECTQRGQRLGVAAVGVTLFLRVKGLQGLPFKRRNAGDIHQSVRLGWRPDFIEQQIDIGV